MRDETGGSMSGAKILVVEDERIVAIDLEDRLLSMGYTVVGNVPSGEQAIALANQTRPDLLLMDIKLNGQLDGVETARIIKDQSDISVVYLTAFADAKTLARAKLTEPAGYILKPFEELQLKTTLEIALYRISMIKKLRESETRFRSIFWQSPVGIALFDKEWRLIDANPACSDMFGIEDLSSLLGYQLNADPGLVDQVKALEIANKTTQFEIEFNFEWAKEQHQLNTVKSGMMFLKCLITPWINAIDAVDGYLIHFQDITEQRMAEERLRYDGLHDAVTQLPNRMYFQVQLEQVIERGKQNDRYLGAVLFMDLDRFKVVNDTLGHSAGDELLKIIAKRLRNNVKSTDFVARFGGDEFVIILDNIKEPGEALLVADRIQQALGKPVDLDGSEIHTSASIGIVYTSQGTSSSDDLVRYADIAMYRAKNNGRAQFAVYETGASRPGRLQP
jgi:diguanylate cyclase (GGDEF)-like protein/PAS domain S-box-containing protein